MRGTLPQAIGDADKLLLVTERWNQEWKLGSRFQRIVQALTASEP